MSLNRAMIIGNLGQDPEIRYTPSGLPVVNLPSPPMNATSTKTASARKAYSGTRLLSWASSR